MKPLFFSVLRRYFCTPLTLLILAASAGFGLLMDPNFLYFSLALTMAGTLVTAAFSLRDGVIRNQCIAGYSKFQIVMCQLLSAAVYGITGGVIYLTVFYLRNSAHLKGVFEENIPRTLLTLLLVFVSCCVLGACFALTVRHAAISAVTAMVLFFVCLILGSNVIFALELPKYHERVETTYVYDENGDYVYDEYGNRKMERTTVYEPEMGYIPSPKRDILEFCTLINPVSPAPDVVTYFYIVQGYQEVEKHDPYYEMRSEERAALAMRNARHKVYPYFQCVVLLALAALTAAFFTRRNLS